MNGLICLMKNSRFLCNLKIITGNCSKNIMSCFPSHRKTVNSQSFLCLEYWLLLKFFSQDSVICCWRLVQLGLAALPGLNVHFGTIHLSNHLCHLNARHCAEIFIYTVLRYSALRKSHSPTSRQRMSTVHILPILHTCEQIKSQKQLVPSSHGALKGAEMRFQSRSDSTVPLDIAHWYL